MQHDDPVTGRRFLTSSAYADDRHLRSRLAIFRYADGPVDPGWRTAPVGWDGTQVVADVGCGAGFDLRRLVPPGRCRRAIGLDLSGGMLRPLRDLAAAGRLTLLQADAQQIPLCDGCVDVALAMHMLYHVPDIPAVVRELARIVRPGGTVLASANSPGSLAEMHQLLDDAISGQLGRPVRAMPGVSFTTESGAAFLDGAFAEVTLYPHAVPLAFPSVGPVVGYLDSVREPILRGLGEPVDFDAVLSDVAARVSQVIQADGRFRTTSRSGVFACRARD